jgi:hypothetical protein
MKNKKLTKGLLLFLLLIVAPHLLYSQVNEMKVVGIVPFSTTSYQDSIAAKNIYSTVARILVQTKRFTLLEIEKWKQTQEEIGRQKGTAFMESRIIDQGKSLGAQLLVFGAVKNAKAFRDENGADVVRVDYDIKFVDVETGKTIASQYFSGDSKSSVVEITKGVKSLSAIGHILKMKDKNAEAASSVIDKLNASDPGSVEGKLVNAIEKTSGKLNKWICNTFGLYLAFLKVTDEDDKQVSQVLIEGGENIDLKEGSKLRAVVATEMDTPGGKVRDEELIAKLEVVEVRPQTSKCKVVNGGKKMQAEKGNKNLRIVLE